jgi:hypothetical protein
MAEHRAPKSLRTRIVRGVLLLAAAAGTAIVGAAGPATAAPNAHAAAAHAAHAPKGFLLLTNGAAAPTLLPPGQAVQVATAACVARGATPAVTTVDAVRAAFPAPFVVCPGVTLTSQVAADAAEAA